MEHFLCDVHVRVVSPGADAEALAVAIGVHLHVAVGDGGRQARVTAVALTTIDQFRRSTRRNNTGVRRAGRGGLTR
jgi:hypothetical protein